MNPQHSADFGSGQIRAISYGGGVQSTALLVLAAQRRIDFSLFLMSNVGDDSEHPATLEYVREVAQPYAEEHGLEMHVLNRRMVRDGSVRTLYQNLTNPEHRSVGIPARMPSGAPGSRACTQDFKVNVVARWLRERGATEENPAVVGIGISLDEIQRANGRSDVPTQRVVYPLIGVGEETGLKMRRDDCIRVIQDAGLPVPPKSSCYFCPFHSMDAWGEMKRNEPDLFEKAAALEDTINAKRADSYPVWLSPAMVPLREAVGDDVPLFEGDGACDSGWCFV